MSEWAAKRFWTEVTVAEVDDGFGIMLDGRRVMTPGKQALVVPTRAMAEKVAEEWAAVDARIDPLVMHWTRSANSAVEKVAPQMDAVRDHLADYAETDLLSYRAERPEALVTRQSKAWDPMLDWADARFGGRLAVTQGVMPVAQDPDAITALKTGASDLGAFELTAFHDLVTLTGSYVLGLRAAEHADEAPEIWQASRIDHDWQVEQWGQDEEAETEAKAKKAAFLHAASFLVLSRDRD